MIIYDGNLWRPNLCKGFAQFTGDTGGTLYKGFYNGEPLESLSEVIEYMKYLKRKQ